MPDKETNEMTPWQAKTWARGFPRFFLCVDQYGCEGWIRVKPPQRRKLAGFELTRALHANALTQSSITPDIHELIDRLEAAENVDLELEHLEAIRHVHDLLCEELNLNAHFRNRLYDILVAISQGRVGADLKKYVGRMKKGVLPDLSVLEEMLDQALNGTLRLPHYGFRPPSW